MRKAAIVLLAALALTACGSPDRPGAGPEVATLRSEAPQAEPSVNVEDQRPLIRSDTSKDEMGRIYQVYDQCLRDHGLPGKDLGRGLWKATVEEESGTYPEVFAACHAKAPESVIDRLKRQNYDEYSDRYHAFVTCIRNAGVDVSTNGDGPLIKFNKEGDSFNDRVSTITDDCRRKAEFE